MKKPSQWFRRKDNQTIHDEKTVVQQTDTKTSSWWRPWTWSMRYPLLSRLDRYLIVKFLGTYFFSILLIISIAVVFDYNDNIDKFTKNHATMHDIIMVYYLNFIPYYANLFSALFIFLSVIFFTTKLAGNSEIIAMQAAGMKFSRIMRPYMISAAIIGALTFYLGSEVIPRGSVKRLTFENTYKRKKKDPTFADRVQMQVQPGVIAYIDHYDNNNKTAYHFFLDKFQNKKLISHLTATSLTYDTLANEKYHWHLNNVTVRDMSTNREYITHHATLDSIIYMEPNDFMVTKHMEETMTNDELLEQIDKQRIRGNGRSAQFELEYHKRFSSPFASFILATIGLTLSAKKRKNGMGLALGTGLALSAGYILFQTVSATFSISAGMSPLLAAWLPNIIFTLIAAYLYKKAPR